MARLLGLVARTCGRIARAAARSEQRPEVAAWFRDQGDKTLRLEYALSPESTVFDLGGYEGQWASDIFARHLCKVHVFEPVPCFAESIRRRFAANRSIVVHEYGLGPCSTTSTISVQGDSSSLVRGIGASVEVRLKSALEFFEEEGIASVELMKVNIEGGEYDLLDHLIETGLIERVRDLQVQFHDFVDDAEQRMGDLQRRLSETHRLTYQYRFVWENWARRTAAR